MNPHKQPRIRSPKSGNRTLQVLDAVGRAIVVGSYDGRPFPTEAQLSEAYGVSRSVTREAMKMLTAKGLLSARPRRGTIIEPTTSWSLFDTDVLRWSLERSFSLELLRYFSELRIAIEPAAAALAAERADAETRADIERGFERMKAAARDADDTLEADIAFHLAIMRGSGNPFYGQFQDVVATALRTSIQFTNRFKGRSADLDTHGAVRDAIMASEPVKAAAAMRSIIEDVIRLMNSAAAQGV